MSDSRSKYWEDMSRLVLDTTIASVETNADGRVTAYLDQTLAYPQGGGQPCDRATIETASGLLDVASVKIDQRGVSHVGQLRHGHIDRGERARLSVDPALRLKHSKLHSAGELICAALRMRGRTWPVVSAVHFPGEAKVVVDAALDEVSRQTVRAELEETLGDLIRRDLPIRCEMIDDRARLAALCGYDPSYLPAHEAIRLVTIIDGLARPCMGTHLTRTGEIGQIEIRNIKAKKGYTSIGYDVQ